MNKITYFYNPGSWGFLNDSPIVTVTISKDLEYVEASWFNCLTPNIIKKKIFYTYDILGIFRQIENIRLPDQKEYRYEATDGDFWSLDLNEVHYTGYFTKPLFLQKILSIINFSEIYQLIEKNTDLLFEVVGEADLSETKGTFTIEYVDDHMTLDCSVNIDEYSIDKHSPLVEEVINHNIGDVFEYEFEVKGKKERSICKLIQKDLNVIHKKKRVVKQAIIFNARFELVKSVEKLNSQSILHIFYYNKYEWDKDGTISNKIINGLKRMKGPGALIAYEFFIGSFIKGFINKFNLNGSDYVLAGVPSHEAKNTNDNSIAGMVGYLSERYKFVNGKNLLIRSRTILPQKNAGKRYIETHLNSIKVNNEVDITGKKIIVMDDITTSGASLLACRQLLFEAGAKEVICFAFAKDS